MSFINSTQLSTKPTRVLTPRVLSELQGIFGTPDKTAMASKFWRSAVQYLAGGHWSGFGDLCLRTVRARYPCGGLWISDPHRAAGPDERIYWIACSFHRRRWVSDPLFRSVPAQSPAGNSGGCHNDSRFLDDFSFCQRSHHPAQVDRGEIARPTQGASFCMLAGTTSEVKDMRPPKESWW